MYSLADDARVLRHLPPFRWFTDGEVACLMRSVQRRSYARREVLQHGGAPVSGVFVVLSGRAAIVFQDDRGHEFAVSLIGASELFGEEALLEDHESFATVRAYSACEVLFIPRCALLKQLEGNAPAATRMLELVLKRLKVAHLKIAHVAHTNVCQRVAGVLLENSKDEADAPVTVGSEQIARLVGSSREMVTRVVGKMIARGVLRRERRKLHVADRAALERIAEGRSASD